MLFLFILGISIVSLFNNISSLVIIAFILLSAIAINIKKLKIKNLIIYTVMLALGAGYYLCSDFYISSKYGNIDEKNRTITITVVSDVKVNETYISFTGKIKEYDNVRVSVLLHTKEKPEYYDVITLKGNVKSFAEEDNTFFFDTKFYNYSNKVYLNVTSENEFTVTEHKNNLLTLLYNFKEKISHIIDMNFSHNGSMLLKGMLIGDKEGRTEEFDDALVKTGLSHIVVVSGMHFTILNFLLVWFLRRLKLTRKMTSFIAIPVSVLLALFVGFSASVLRALIMIIVLNFADLIDKERKTDVYLVLLTAVIMIVFNPYVIHNAGFILSFTSVCGILIFNERLCDKLKFLPEFLRYPVCVSLSANILTLPLVTYYFNGFPVLFVISNLIVNLYITFIMAYGIVVIFISLISMRIGGILAVPLDSLINFTVRVITEISNISISYITSYTIEKYSILLYYLAIFFLCSIKNKIVRYILSSLLLLYFLLSSFFNINTYIFDYADIYAYCGADSGKVLINYKDNSIFIDLSVSNKEKYSDLITKTCNGDVDVCILGNAFNFKAVKNNNLNAETLYYPERTASNDYINEIIDNNFEKAISVDKEISLNYDDMHLTLKLDKSYNIGKIIVTLRNREIVITNDFETQFEDECEYIITYKMISEDSSYNILNCKENEIERIRL